MIRRSLISIQHWLDLRQNRTIEFNSPNWNNIANGIVWSISNNERYLVHKRVCVYSKRTPRDASECNRASRLFHEINFWESRTSLIQGIWESLKEELASFLDLVCACCVSLPLDAHMGMFYWCQAMTYILLSSFLCLQR